LKAVVIGVTTRAFGYVNMAPWIVGLGLSQIGEFSFVLARAGSSLGALTEQSYDLALSCTVLTMALSPIVARLASPIGNLFQRRSVSYPVGVAVVLAGKHIVVVGYGRVGRGAVDFLRGSGESIVVVETDYLGYADAAAAGVTAIWGDIADTNLEEAIRLSEAKAVVLTMADEVALELALQQCRSRHKTLRIVVLAMNDAHAEFLLEKGADAVIQPEREGGAALARAALTSLG